MTMNFSIFYIVLGKRKNNTDNLTLSQHSKLNASEKKHTFHLEEVEISKSDDFKQGLESVIAL